MSYVKTQWVNGDTITADKLNHIEAGIEANETENSLLKSQIETITGNKKIAFIQGKFIATSTATVDVTDLRNGTNNSVAVVSCVSGDVFTINAQGGNASRAWAFINASGTVLERADASIAVENMVLTAPDDSAYLVVNDTENSGRISYKGLVLKRETDKIKRDTAILYDGLMEQGKLSTASGYPPILVSSDTTIRTKNFAPWSPGFCVSLKPGYEGCMLICDSDGNFLAVNGWGKNLVKSDVTGGALAKVIIRKTNGTDMVPSEISGCYTYSDIPLEEIKSKADEIDFILLQNVTEAIDEKTSRFASEVVLNPSDGVMATNGNVTTGVGIHASISVSKGDLFELIAQKGSSSYPAYLFFKGSTLVSYGDTTPTGGYRSYAVSIPDNVDTLIVNSMNVDMMRLIKMTKSVSAPKSMWVGKKIVWFGTSIPAPSNRNPYIGYPEYVASHIGATVYNEAVPSSMARGGAYTAISADDPYGWTGIGYVAAIRNMGSTIAEKQEMIDNWNNKWKALVGGNHDLTSDEAAFALTCSYENKLGQYLTNPVDLYVFDHGFNDWSANDANMYYPENDPYNMRTFFGAMNQYIRLIYQMNPRANIVMISHYETDERPGLIKIQEEIANYWNIPFFKLCDRLGWCYSRKITSEGHWITSSNGDGIWVPDGGTPTEYRLTQAHIPDGRHPNLDVSGCAIRDIGEAIIPFLNTVSPNL